MISTTDRIERSVLIAAPVERVWTLITTAEHLGTWFGDASASIDLRPGGHLALTWKEHGTVRGRVEAVEPPRRFAYRWMHGEDATPADSTLVEFVLTPEPGGCRVVVTESGFDTLERADRAELFASHETGWGIELGHLAEHAGRP